MAAKFKNGTKVRQIVSAPIEGEVVAFSFDEQSGDIRYVVQWTDESGQLHQRGFDEDQIEVA
jgi:PKD repeat protein